MKCRIFSNSQVFKTGGVSTTVFCCIMWIDAAISHSGTRKTTSATRISQNNIYNFSLIRNDAKGLNRSSPIKRTATITEESSRKSEASVQHSFPRENSQRLSDHKYLVFPAGKYKPKEVFLESKQWKSFF